MKSLHIVAAVSLLLAGCGASPAARVATMPVGVVAAQHQIVPKTPAEKAINQQLLARYHRQSPEVHALSVTADGTFKAEVHNQQPGIAANLHFIDTLKGTYDLKTFDITDLTVIDHVRDN